LSTILTNNYLKKENPGSHTKPKMYRSDMAQVNVSETRKTVENIVVILVQQTIPVIQLGDCYSTKTTIKKEIHIN